MLTAIRRATGHRRPSSAYCMSGQYGHQCLQPMFPRTLQAAASIYGVQLAPNRPDSPSSRRTKDRCRTLFRCAEDRFTPMDIVKESKTANEGVRANAKSRIIPARITVLRSETAGLRQDRLRTSTGNGCVAVSPHLAA